MSDTGCTPRFATFSRNVAKQRPIGRKKVRFSWAGSSGFLQLWSALDGAFCRQTAHPEVQQNLALLQAFPVHCAYLHWSMS